MSAVGTGAGLERLALLRATFGVAHFRHFRHALAIPLTNVMYIHDVYYTPTLTESEGEGAETGIFHLDF